MVRLLASELRLWMCWSPLLLCLVTSFWFSTFLFVAKWNGENNMGSLQKLSRYNVVFDWLEDFATLLCSVVNNSLLPLRVCIQRRCFDLFSLFLWHIYAIVFVVYLGSCPQQNGTQAENPAWEMNGKVCTLDLQMISNCRMPQWFWWRNCPPLLFY